MHYLLTGATGLIGRHILFELLHKILAEQRDSKVGLLVRAKNGRTALQRIVDLLRDPESPEFIRRYALDDLLPRIEVIEQSLGGEELESSLRGFASNGVLVIHNAASTNLMRGDAAESDVVRNNLNATYRLVRSIPSENIERFVFISTAFSCGVQSGEAPIPVDYAEVERQIFRNPYERCKAQAEQWLEQYCAQHGIDLQIIRPSVVCGRLMDPPLYCTTKFDVFYGFAKFFHKMKDRLSDDPFRIHINPQGGLNVVPVDYVAKVICSGIHRPDLPHINAVSPRCVPNDWCLAEILGRLGVEHFDFVGEMPEQLSPLEKLYYKTAGEALTPYALAGNQLFDTRHLDQSFPALQCPDIADGFGHLIDYAIQKDFKPNEFRLPA